jgi:hypothetical protein
MFWSNLLITRAWFIAITFAALISLDLAPGSAQTTQNQKVNSAKKVSSNPTEPTAAQLRGLVEQSLEKNPYYFPGSMICRRDVEVLFSNLLRQGVTSTNDQEDLAECVLPDSSYLAGRLMTPNGRAFMKTIASDPTAYDRLERLSWTPDGRQLIDTYIKSKDGPAKLQQLKTPEQLAKLSKRLAADPRTADFALPTSKAHTAEELIAKLTEVLAAKNSAE